MRRFKLVRYDDPSGVSGVGIVAYGVEFPDGTCAVHWHGDYPCTQVWPSVSAASQVNGLIGVRAVHGHSGRTMVRWVDGFVEPNERD